MSISQCNPLNGFHTLLYGMDSGQFLCGLRQNELPGVDNPTKNESGTRIRSESPLMPYRATLTFILPKGRSHRGWVRRQLTTSQVLLRELCDLIRRIALTILHSLLRHFNLGQRNAGIGAFFQTVTSCSALESNEGSAENGRIVLYRHKEQKSDEIGQFLPGNV